MAFAVAGVAQRYQAVGLRDVQAQRSCLLRVTAPRLEQVEPSPQDDLPVTRARYNAGAFAPPAARVAVKDTPRTTAPPVLGPYPSSQLQNAEGPLQRSTPLPDSQLEEFSSTVLSSASHIWSADERSLPASTSDSSPPLDVVLAQVKGKGRLAVVGILKGLTKRGELEAVIRVLQECTKPTLQGVSVSWQHKEFLSAVIQNRDAKLAVQFCKLMAPLCRKPAPMLTSALQVCASCRDLDAGVALVESARKQGLAIDEQIMTTLIKVCKSVGNVDRAFRVYSEMRAAGLRIDNHVYGTLIATCAEAMKRDLTVVHERKDQFVLLERAFQYVADAEAAGVTLQAPVWNALMTCAGRSGELNRAFEVLTMMQQRGIPASATTYGSLIEACVTARQPEKALRVFEVALAKGFVTEVKLYTQALSACKLPFTGAWERALRIYSALQRASVRPDKKFFACLMAVAGRCGRLDTTFDLLNEMYAERIRPSGSIVSAMIHACLDRGNLSLARNTYDLCAKMGVYPVPSQFNRLMDVYASESRFGDVVTLLCDMVAAGRQPNLNTYRILINACAFTDQAGLAFQVFALMHANKVPILQTKFAQTIYYMLIKACLNQTRFLWAPGGYPPAEPQANAANSSDPSNLTHNPAHTDLQAQAANSHANGNNGSHALNGHSASSSSSSALHTSPGSSLHPHPQGLAFPADRRLEAEKVLAALGGHKLRRGAHQSNPFDGPPDTIDWASHALSAFHHMLGKGFKPTLELLDCLLSCMRAKMLPHEDEMLPGIDMLTGVGGLGRGQPAGPRGVAGSHYVTSPFVPLRDRNEVFEAAFEPRAFAVIEEAIARGLLPPYDPDAPLVMDMRRVPPVVAEVYALYILFSLERRSRRKKSAAGVGPTAANGASLVVATESYHHSITFLVPAFDPDLVKWPSYTERLMNRYTSTMHPDARAKLRHRSEFRRSRCLRRRRIAAAAASRSSATAPADDADSGSFDSQRAAGANGALQSADSEAMSSYDELEAAMSSDSEDSDQDAWAHDDMEDWASEEAADGEGVDPAGGAYMADSTTGLSVAATLQRMKVWMDMDYQHGSITVFAVEVARWLKRRRQAAEAAYAAAATASAPGSERQAAPGQRPDPLSMVDMSQAAEESVPPVQSAVIMGGLAAGIMAGARYMGVGARTAPGSPATLLEQQRNIRLGMRGAGMGGPVARNVGAALGGDGDFSQIPTGSGLSQAQYTGRGTVGAPFNGSNGATSMNGNSHHDGAGVTSSGSQNGRSRVAAHRPASAPPAVSTSDPQSHGPAPESVQSPVSHQAPSSSQPRKSLSTEPETTARRPSESRSRGVAAEQTSRLTPRLVAVRPITRPQAARDLAAAASAQHQTHTTQLQQQQQNGHSTSTVGNGHGVAATAVEIPAHVTAQQFARSVHGPATAELLRHSSHVEVAVGPGVPVKLPLA